MFVCRLIGPREACRSETGWGGALCACSWSLPHPVLASYGGQIVLLDPPEWFVGRSPVSPGPSRVKKRLVYLDAGRLAGDVPVILRPSVPNRGALPAQIARRRWGLPGASAADLRSPGLPLLLRWGAATRAILRAAERWSQAVNTILTLRAPGFVGCKCQAACWPDRGTAGGALRLPALFGALRQPA